MEQEYESAWSRPLLGITLRTSWTGRGMERPREEDRTYVECVMEENHADSRLDSR